MYPKHGALTAIPDSNKHQINRTLHYVEDILLIYDKRRADIDKTLAEFNEIEPTIKFTTVKESHNSGHFLDILMHCSEKEIKCAVYRKPNQTDIIPNDSCHPHKHKTASINYLVSKPSTYPISNEAKEMELNIV
jgi:hypothetical protein